MPILASSLRLRLDAHSTTVERTSRRGFGVAEIRPVHDVTGCKVSPTLIGEDLITELIVSATPLGDIQTLTDEQASALDKAIAGGFIVWDVSCVAVALGTTAGAATIVCKAGEAVLHVVTRPLVRIGRTVVGIVPWRKFTDRLSHLANADHAATSSKRLIKASLLRIPDQIVNTWKREFKSVLPMGQNEVLQELERRSPGISISSATDYAQKWPQREFEAKGLLSFLRAGGKLLIPQPRDGKGEIVDAVVEFGGKIYAYEAKEGFYLAADLVAKWKRLKAVESTLGLSGQIDGMIHAAGEVPKDLVGIENNFSQHTSDFLQVVGGLLQ